MRFVVLCLMFLVGCADSGTRTFALKYHLGAEGFHFGHIRSGARIVGISAGAEMPGSPDDTARLRLEPSIELTERRDFLLEIDALGVAGFVARSGADGYLAIDANGDRVVSADELTKTEAWPTLFVTVVPARPGRPKPIPIELSIRAKRIEYRRDEHWQATLEVGAEQLTIAVVPLGVDGEIVFADPQRDGQFSAYLQKDNPIALGGLNWSLSIDLTQGVAKLVKSDEDPVDRGYLAPPIRTETEALPATDGERPSLLVFCFAGCFACQKFAPSFEAFRQQYAGQLNCLAVAPNPAEAEKVSSVLKLGFAIAIAAQAWKDYRVTPTPTVFVVAADGHILYRGDGQRDGDGRELGNVLRDCIRKEFMPD